MYWAKGAEPEVLDSINRFGTLCGNSTIGLAASCLNDRNELRRILWLLNALEKEKTVGVPDGI
jgi:hypothetical protein